MEEWKIIVEKTNEEEIHRVLDINPAKLIYLYYFEWENIPEQEKKEFYHILQYEEYIKEHKNTFPDSKLIQICDASKMVRKITDMELIDLLRHDGQNYYDFEIKWNNQPFIKYERFKNKEEFYSYQSIMRSGDGQAQIIEIYQTRRTIN